MINTQKLELSSAAKAMMANQNQKMMQTQNKKELQQLMEEQRWNTFQIHPKTCHKRGRSSALSSKLQK